MRAPATSPCHGEGAAGSARTTAAGTRTMALAPSRSHRCFFASALTIDQRRCCSKVVRRLRRTLIIAGE